MWERDNRTHETRKKIKGGGRVFLLGWAIGEGAKGRDFFPPSRGPNLSELLGLLKGMFHLSFFFFMFFFSFRKILNITLHTTFFFLYIFLNI